MIFIVGNSRSGTTMMGRILGNHSKVFTFKEIHFFEQLWSTKDADITLSLEESIRLFTNLISIEREGYLNPKRNKTRYVKEVKDFFDTSEYSELSKIEVFHLFLNYEAASHQKIIPCDQTPRNLFYVKEILDYYPGAKIINMVRDPRDILLSQKNKWKRRFLGAKNIPLKESFRSRMNYHPITISKLWMSNINHYKKFENNTNIKTIKFEDLLQNPKEVIFEICRFLNLDFQSAMLQIPQIGSSGGKDDNSKVGINRERMSSFKNGGLSQEEIEICQYFTGVNMKYFGYEKINTSTSKFKKSLLCFTFPLKLSLALIFNLKRMNNILETLKRRIV